MTKNIVVYVKNEGANLNTMTTALKIIINCETLGVMEIFHGICFGCIFFKVANMQLLKKKGLKYVSIKYMQANLQKYIMWLKKSRKGIQEWMTTCITTSFKLKKLNMLIIKKVKCKLFILVFFFIVFTSRC